MFFQNFFKSHKFFSLQASDDPIMLFYDIDVVLIQIIIRLHSGIERQIGKAFGFRPNVLNGPNEEFILGCLGEIQMKTVIVSYHCRETGLPERPF